MRRKRLSGASPSSSGPGSSVQNPCSSNGAAAVRMSRALAYAASDLIRTVCSARVTLTLALVSLA